MEKDIEKRILIDYGKKAKKVLKIIDEFESKMNLSPRVSRCILHLADGNEEKLNYFIKIAETDWRDIIGEAEIIDFEFNKPFNF